MCVMAGHVDKKKRAHCCGVKKRWSQFAGRFFSDIPDHFHGGIGEKGRAAT